MRDDSTGAAGREALVEAYERACAAYSNALVAEYDAETAESANPSTDVHTPLHKAIDATREARIEWHRTREALDAWDREHAAAPDLDAIEARANAATEGPWFFDSYSTVVSKPLVREYDRIEATIPEDAADDDPRWDALPETHICGVPCIAGDTGTAQGVHDARFIAEAREDVPALCAEVRRLRARAEGDQRATAEATQASDNLIDALRGLNRNLETLCGIRDADVARLSAERDAWRKVTGAETPQALAAELDIARAKRRAGGEESR